MKIIKGKEYEAIIECHKFKSEEEIDEDCYVFFSGEKVIPEFVFFKNSVGHVYLGSFKNAFDQTISKTVPVEVFSHCFKEVNE